jgi:hypothetical protein
MWRLAKMTTRVSVAVAARQAGISRDLGVTIVTGRWSLRGGAVAYELEGEQRVVPVATVDRMATGALVTATDGRVIVCAGPEVTGAARKGA